MSAIFSNSWKTILDCSCDRSVGCGRYVFTRDRIYEFVATSDGSFSNYHYKYRYLEKNSTQFTAWIPLPDHSITVHFFVTGNSVVAIFFSRSEKARYDIIFINGSKVTKLDTTAIDTS